MATGQIGNYDTLREIVKMRKLGWFGHVARPKIPLANNILQGRPKVEEKISRRRPARQWMDDVKEWTGLSWKKDNIYMTELVGG